MRWHPYKAMESVNVRHCGIVVSAAAWDGTGCEFDSWLGLSKILKTPLRLTVENFNG